MEAVNDGLASPEQDRLPPIVRRSIERNVPEGPLPAVTRVFQRGRMWKSPGSKPMDFVGIAEYGGGPRSVLLAGEVPDCGPARVAVDR